MFLFHHPPWDATIPCQIKYPGRFQGFWSAPAVPGSCWKCCFGPGGAESSRMWTEPARGLARPAGGSESTITSPTPAEELRGQQQCVGQKWIPVASRDSCVVVFMQNQRHNAVQALTDIWSACSLSMGVCREEVWHMEGRGMIIRPIGGKCESWGETERHNRRYTST